MNSRVKLVVSSSFMSALITAVLVSGFWALADNNPITDNVAKIIPYRGHLIKDGVPFSGTVKMRFRLYDGVASGAPVWSEEQNVNVYNGTFMVMLGSTAGTNGDGNLWRVIKNADDLYLEIAIVEGEGDNEQEIVLANRQRFLPVPYSLWTTASTDFDVRTIKGIGGELRLDANYLTFTGTDISFGAYQDRGDGGRALVHASDDTLALNWDNDFAGGIKLFGDVSVASVTLNEETVGGNLHVDNDLSIGGKIESNVQIGGALNIESGNITLGSITNAISIAQDDENPNDYNLVLKGKGKGHVMLDDTDLIFNEIEGRGGGRALVSNENDTLIINFEGDFSGGVRVEGDSIELPNSNCRFGCEKVSEEQVPVSLNTVSPATYCSEGKYVCGMKIVSEPGNTTKRYYIECCPF